MNKNVLDVYNKIYVDKSMLPVDGTVRFCYDDDKYTWQTHQFDAEKLYDDEGRLSRYAQINLGKFINDICKGRVGNEIAVEDVLVYNNKVVIVKFMDGTQTKAIFDGDGTFSVYNGVAICLAKKLIGEDSTKIFNNTMRSAMKIYNIRESKLASKSDDAVQSIKTLAKNKIEPDIIAKVNRFRKEGMSESAVAKRLGYSVYELRRKLSIARVRRNSELRKQYRKLINEGKNASEIAKEMKRSESFVRNILDNWSEIDDEGR